MAKAQKKSTAKSPVKKAESKAKKVVKKVGKSAKESPIKKTEKLKAVAPQAAKKEVSAKDKKPVKVAAKPLPVQKEKIEIATPAVLTAAEPAEKPKKIKTAKIDKTLLNLSERPLSELQKKWTEYKEKYGKEKAPLYNMANTYEAAAPLQHKVLGWGFVVSVQNDRLEVLFESGSKTLISNYRPR